MKIIFWKKRRLSIHVGVHIVQMELTLALVIKVLLGELFMFKDALEQ